MKQLPTAANQKGEEKSIAIDLKKEKMRGGGGSSTLKRGLKRRKRKTALVFFSFSCYFLCLFPRASRANRFVYTSNSHQWRRHRCSTPIQLEQKEAPISWLSLVLEKMMMNNKKKKWMKKKGEGKEKGN